MALGLDAVMVPSGADRSNPKMSNVCQSGAKSGEREGWGAGRWRARGGGGGGGVLTKEVTGSEEPVGQSCAAVGRKKTVGASNELRMLAGGVGQDGRGESDDSETEVDEHVDRGGSQSGVVERKA